MGCLIAPIMLVFASPHHLYLPSLGFVLLLSAMLAAIAGGEGARWPRPRAVACSALVLVLALGLAVMAWAMGFAYARGVLSEDLTVRDVRRNTRQLRDGDHLFFINLPMLAYYAIPAIEQELGFHDLHGHVLVFAPDLMCAEAPTRVEALDRHRLRVIAPAGKRYLSGVTGNMLLGVMGIDARLPQGQVIDAGLFTVTVVARDAQGVQELLFTFRKPMDSPGYHIYLGSPQFMAVELGDTLLP
jgi:hypothetical protein